MTALEHLPDGEFLSVVDAAGPLHDALRATGENRKRHSVIVMMAILSALADDEQAEVLQYFASMHGALH